MINFFTRRDAAEMRRGSKGQKAAQGAGAVRLFDPERKSESFPHSFLTVCR
jgi:hypothetical protein